MVLVLEVTITVADEADVDYEAIARAIEEAAAAMGAGVVITMNVREA